MKIRKNKIEIKQYKSIVKPHKSKLLLTTNNNRACIIILQHHTEYCNIIYKKIEILNLK